MMMVMCDVRSWCGWYLCSRPVNYSSNSNSNIYSVILVQSCAVIKLLTLTRVNGGWMEVDIGFMNLLYYTGLLLKVLPGKAADCSLCKAESLPFRC